VRKPKTAGQSGDTASLLKSVGSFGLLIRNVAAGGLLTILSACAAEQISLPSAQMQSPELRAERLLERMTLEEKVGQIIQADIASVTPEEVKAYNLGSVLNGGNSAPGGGKVASVEQWIALADAFWEASTDASDGGVGIPLLWGTDAVHGHSNIQSAVIFPHNIGLGAARDPDLLGRIAAVTAKEVRATGLDWNFAPTLAVAQDDRWGRTYESYSEDPAIVASYAGAIVEGMQGKPGSPGFLKGEKVIATAKHFVGDGGTENGIDKGDTKGSLDAIWALHGAGYQPAIDADVQTVMASFSSINGRKMHGYHELLTDKLRGELGFTGFVIGDWNGHAEIPGCTATDCVAALNAGLDMYMASDSWRGLYGSLLGKAKSGELDIRRLDEAVLRILRVKIRSGLVDGVKPSQRAASGPDKIGTAEHRAVGREAVRKSLVLLKNNNGVLPLNPNQHILVTGSGANSIQQQTGGWTLNWQGDDNRNDEFVNAETIFDGISKAFRASGGTAKLSVDGKFDKRPDVAVVIFGEEPYAEYRGDRSDLVFEGKDGDNLALLNSFKAQDIPVVAVFLSGRPMWVNPLLNASDAFVAAWLPGTEGGGVADVLVGDAQDNVRYDFVGRLSFSWPSLGDGKPINGPEAKGALFPLGYGLDYTNNAVLAVLSEDPGVDLTKSFDGTIVNRGDAAGRLSLYLGDSTNANVPAPALISKSLSGAVATAGIDYKAQEDARKISFSGAGPASLSIRAPRSLDLSGRKSDALLIEWRMDSVPTGKIKIGMSCGEGCSGMIEASNVLKFGETDAWRVDSISLQCFVKAGLDLSKVSAPFVLEADSRANISLHRIALSESNSTTKSCAN
jgi:beta-glucosidase